MSSSFDIRRLLVCAAMGLVAGTGFAMEVEENPCQAIAVRDPFRLVHPTTGPAQTPPPGSSVAPKPSVVVTGVTNVGGRPQALLEIVELGRPVGKPVLGEGEVFAGVQVLGIDVARAEVRLRLADEERVVALAPGPASARR